MKERHEGNPFYKAMLTRYQNWVKTQQKEKRQHKRIKDQFF
jgi:hypothetical protein